VGDITVGKLRQALTRLARLRPTRRPARGRIRPAPPAARFFFVRVPDAKQAVISLAHHGPSRHAPDYFANELMADILGGAFSSRINMNIREKRGYAYGAWGGFSYTRRGGYFVSAASVRNDVVGPALREVFGEIVKMQREPVTETERRREIDGAVLRLPSFFAGARATLRSYRELVYHGLPLDSYDRYINGYRAVTRRQIERAARRHLRPGELRVLVVGDPKHFADQLSRLAREASSPVVELDSDGRPLNAAGTPHRGPAEN
jgi:zinc protease